MSEAIDTRDAIVVRLRSALGCNVFAFRGEFAADRILQVARTLPAVAVACYGSPSAQPDHSEPTELYSFGAYVVTKAVAAAPDRLSDPGDTAMRIARNISYQILTGQISADAPQAARSTNRRIINASGEKGPFGQGYGFVSVLWDHEITMLPESTIASLDDLETVDVQMDIADIAPDGSTPPDGVFEFRRTVTGLDE